MVAKRYFASSSPYKVVKGNCRVCEIPNGFLACKVMSRH